MRTVRRLLCALGWRRFCGTQPERSHDEMEEVRRRQRAIVARAEALGVRVDVIARERTRR